MTRLQLAKNALTLVARKDFWDVERVAILETYLGMLQEPLSLHDLSTGAEHSKYAIRTVSIRENQMIGEAVNKNAREVSLADLAGKSVR